MRGGVAYGDVVSRLGDVFGPTVNIASRLTSVARPGTVLVDRGLHDVLSGPTAEDTTATEESSPYSEAGGYHLRRMPRRSVKGYSKLEPFVLRRAKER